MISKFDPFYHQTPQDKGFKEGGIFRGSPHEVDSKSMRFSGCSVHLLSQPKSHFFPPAGIHINFHSLLFEPRPLIVPSKRVVCELFGANLAAIQPLYNGCNYIKTEFLENPTYTVTIIYGNEEVRLWL